MQVDRKRIWGWMMFDWAAQPYATLGLTFVFAPYFAAVAAGHYAETGLEKEAADVAAQRLWSTGQTIAGLFIAFTAPFLGAWADASGRKMPWIWVFTAIAVICSASLWHLMPDGTGLVLTLTLFWVGFVASESGFNLNNAILPSLGDHSQTGRISGNAVAFGYWGGVLALFIVLLFFAENESGKTLIGLSPAFGLDPDLREGTRSVGPFIAVWFAIFMIPYFLWIHDDSRTQHTARPRIGAVLRLLRGTLAEVAKQRSTTSFLLSSMFYRDALTGLYAYGGIYATQVLGWHIIQIGVFGIIAAIAAATLSWIGGIADARFGPKPVIRFCIWALILVCAIIVGMTRQSFLGIPLPAGSILPDVTLYICGALIGGAGGALYSASRSLMVRHADPVRSAEAFGLFALSGRATTWLAPLLINLAGHWTQSNRLSYLPLILLFVIGLVLLRRVSPEGEYAP